MRSHGDEVILGLVEGLEFGIRAAELAGGFIDLTLERHIEILYLLEPHGVLDSDEEGAAALSAGAAVDSIGTALAPILQ